MTDSKILDLLPQYWRQEPLMRAFANAVGKPFDQWRMLVGQVYRFFDPWAAPEFDPLREGVSVEWIDGLMRLVGIPRLEPFLTTQQKRGLAANAYKTWIQKGTEEGIESYLRAVAGIDADVVRTNTTAFVCGISKCGDVCGLGAVAWTFEVRIPSATGLTETEVRNLLRPVVSSIETYDVVFT